MIPDLNCCLLHQKLQVLDHCIQLRSVGSAAVGPQLVSPVVERSRQWTDYDYDDLFDDLGDQSVQISTVQSDPISINNAEQTSSFEVLPEGVNPDITLPNVYLLDGITKMNVPITLESPILTEDQASSLS